MKILKPLFQIMLNERIEKCIEIADTDGLFFVWKNLMSGITSLESLDYFRLHHNGKINVDIEITILLYDQLQIVKFENDLISLPEDLHATDYSDKDTFLIWFSKLFLQYLINENIVEIDSVKYDSQSDKYILPRGNIKYRFASYRNLLLTLGILSKREDGNYIIENHLSDIVKITNKDRAKLTEAALLKMLEEQRMQGESGEEFVLEYENKRLTHRSDKYKIKRISVIDVSAGYDIISFNDLDSPNLDRFVEVKTFKGNPHFHWSANEIKTASVRSNHYYLYLVDYDKISLYGYDPIIICDPISYFENNAEWSSAPESFIVNKISD